MKQNSRCTRKYIVICLRFSLLSTAIYCRYSGVLKSGLGGGGPESIMTQNVGDGELERSPRDTLLAIDKLSVGGGVKLMVSAI